MRTTQYDTDNRYANVQHEPRIVHDRLQELLRLDIDTTNPDYRAQFDSFPHIILHSMEKDTNTSLRKHICREHLTYLHILLHSLFSAVSYQIQSKLNIYGNFPPCLEQSSESAHIPILLPGNIVGSI